MSNADVTLKDIAQAVGKSVATVSKALHNHTDIAPQTRVNIQGIAQQMGYRPNVTAQRLQKQKTDALGLILPVLSARQADPFFTELLSGVADEAATNGFDLLVSARTPGKQEEQAYQKMVNQRRVDGVIVAQPRLQDWRIDFLTTEKIPFVLVGHLAHANPVSSPGVWINMVEGLKKAIAHLIKEGRTNIALIPPPSNLSFSQAWVTTFKDIMASTPNLRQQLAGNIKTLTQKEGYQAAQALLASNNIPDAIITCHDLVAMGAIAAVQGQGFQTGTDIAIIGFGDILLAEYTQPPLTTLHQSTYTMGQQACQMLLHLIANKPLATATIVINPWLVVRQSSSLALWL